MAHSTKFPASDQLVQAFNKAKNDKSIRYLKVEIKDEKLELVEEGKNNGTTSIDFNNLKNVLQPKQACYIIFRLKEAFDSAPWALISFIPDDIPVNEKMVYSSTIFRVKEVLGITLFGEDRRFGEVSEVNFNNLKSAAVGSGTSNTNSNNNNNSDKPWSKRELAQQQLDESERQARSEYASGKTGGGLHAIEVPLSSEATSALNQLKAGSINWVQLSVDEAGKAMTSVASKQVTGSLSALISTKEPQFYLHTTRDAVVLVYACPDNSPVQLRMIYPTSKSALAHKLKSLGFTKVIKIDIREPSELTTAAIDEAFRNKASTIFKPTDSMLKGNSSPSNLGTGIKSNEFDVRKPVFNRPGFSSGDHGNVSNSNPKAKNVTQGEAPSAMRVFGSSNKPKPKGVVIPPDGAYC
jgi:twinfilin-like protein